VNHDMKKNLKLSIILITLITVTLLVILLVTHVPYLLPSPPLHAPIEFIGHRPSHEVPGDIELFYTFKTVISTINVTLLIFLLIGYTSIYRKTKSEFTIGLLIFSMTLLLYAISSNPLIHWLFGFRAFGLGPFAMLPDLFTCVALSVLLYLTFKY
jgi:hypothetical protein